MILAATGAQGADFRIRYAEPAVFRTRTGATVHAAQFTTQRQVLRLEAYGRQFDLELTPNGRLLRAMPAKRRLALEKYPLLRGQISGLPGSWVRITRVGDQLFGAFWDGTELYTISPAAAARRFSVAPLPNADGNDTVVYRLSDTDSVLGLRFDHSVPSGKAAAQGLQYQALVAELQTNSSLPQEQIELAVIGDHEFYTAHPLDTEGALLARMNIVDGIFSEQVGVTLVVPELRVFRTTVQPFNTNAAETLLQQLGNYRSTEPEIASRGLAHLFTGRDIRDSKDNIVGIAYIDALCDTRFGVGITEGNLDFTTSALTAAHEIGHNFGAPHDGDAPCASTPPGFLMDPFINGSSTFSQCSLGRMRPSIDAATCITRSSIGDASLEGTATSVSGFTGEAFTWPIDVDSVGNAPVRDVTVTIPIPGSVTIDSAIVPDGTCATGGGAVTCTLGVLDHDTSRRIEVRLRANAAMSYDSTVRVSGGNDRDASNNVANVHLQINAATELRVTTVQTPVAGFTREPIAFSYLVSAGGVQTSPGVTVVITAGGVIINSATAAGATCTNLNTSQVTCALGDMAPGTSRRIDLSATATYAFSFSASAKATSTNMANYTASVGVRIDVASAQDAAVRLDPRIRTVTINEPFTASANLESAGPQAVNDVVLTILPSPQLVINSVIAPGGTCTSSAPFTCSFATLATGTASRIDVNAVATEFGLHHVSFRVVAQGDDEARNDFGDINVQANFAADIKVYPFENFYARETQTLRMFTRMSSAGVRAAENVSMTFNLPESLSIVSIASTTASCSNSERTATCTLPSLAPGSEALVQYEVQSTRVGTFSASAVVSAGNDGDSSNNQQAVKIEIGPFMDAALVPSTLPTHVETEDSFDVPLTVTTNGYPMADATLGVYTQLDVISVSAPGTCETVSPSYICHLGDLPANASIPIALRLRASKSGPYSVMLALNVLNDMFDTNNRLVFSVTARKHGDAAVQLGSQQLTSPVNRRTAFPEITVTGMTTVDDVVVRIGMPVTVYAESLSLDGQGGSCQVGNSEVLCSLGTVTADTPRHINFDIAGSRGGTFVSDVTLTSALDENPGNNQASVSMRFEGSTGGGGAGDAGGGGGGALEWTSLACLIAGLARRRRTPGYRERPEYS